MKITVTICATWSLLALALLAPASSAEPSAAAGSAVRTDIEFAKVGDESLTLDAFVPEGKGPFPTCILVHGGGWVRGDKQTFIKPLFEPLSKAGFTWFSINYRLAPAHRWPACADDVATAIRWVRANAKEYKVDAGRIAIIGESAGGHLVSWAGTHASGNTSVAAVVAFYAPNDLERRVRGTNMLGPSVTALFDVSEVNDATYAILHDASPINHIHSGLPPFLLIHGTADVQVKYEQSEWFQARTRAAGNLCDLITVRDGAHGMGGWEKLGSKYQSEMIDWLREVLSRKRVLTKDDRRQQTLDGLKSRDVEVRRTAIRSLTHNDIAASLIGEIQAALGDEDAVVREWAATVIGPQGEAAASAIPKLIAQMQQDPVKQCRETAARALGRIGRTLPENPAMNQALEEAGAKDADSVTRVVALGALALMKPDSTERMEAVSPYLQSTDGLTRMKAAHALGYLGERAAKAGPAIAKALQSATDPHERGYLGRALGQIGDRSQLPILLAEIAKETDPTALGEMKGAARRLENLSARGAVARPPVAPVKVVKDTYYGTTIADPYRYMEQFKDADVQAWVRGQADYTDRTLHALPGRERLLKRIDELDAGAPYSLANVTRRAGGDLFYFKQLANENVAKLYVRDGQTSAERLLIDPEKFPKQDPKDHFTLSFYRVSPDGSKILYGFAASGSEQTILRVFDRTANKELPDTIDRMESEYALPYWLPDGKSFVYSRRRKLAADAPATEGYKFTQALRHVIGENPDDDVNLLGSTAANSPKLDEMDFPAVIVPFGSSWVVGQIKHGDETDISLYTAPRNALGSTGIEWTKVCDRADQVTSFAVHGDDIYLLTAHDAPRFKVVRTPLSSPDMRSAAVVIPAGEYVVDSITAAKDALYAGILEGVPHKLVRVPYSNGAKFEPIILPADEPSGFIEAANPELPGIFVRTRAWTREGRLYRFDPETKTLADTGLLPRGRFDSPEGLTSTEVMVASHDGVRVPLSIIHRQDLRLDGRNPTILSGYGAYGHIGAMTYDPTNLAWLERGGVLAVAHVRGGGAHGKEWHHAGRKATKPNTWKDFIACAEHLVKAGYTSPAKLAGRGGSAGGILIGRAITERPDLFAAAQSAVGCSDMLRFETTMNGPPNVPEFGTISKEDEFSGLLAMSTLHHIHDGTKYPAVLFTHGINDPRVEPWQSAKATARFQAATASGKPVLFRVDYHSGHGIGSTRQQRHEEKADVWSFFLWQFGDPEFQPK
jgi:prolyl oligopeptidase